MVNLVGSLSVLMLLCALSLVALRRYNSSIVAVSLQSLLLAVATALVAHAMGNREGYLAAILTLAVKAVAIPFILHWVKGRTDSGGGPPLKELSPGWALLVAGLVVILAYQSASPVTALGGVLIRASFPQAMSILLLGLFILIVRRSALLQIIGLLVMENGLYLSALTATGGMPVVVEMGMFLDLLVGVLIMGVFSSRIVGAFRSLDTDRLHKLKG